jgi:hypothetical protein
MYSERGAEVSGCGPTSLASHSPIDIIRKWTIAMWECLCPCFTLWAGARWIPALYADRGGVRPMLQTCHRSGAQGADLADQTSVGGERLLSMGGGVAAVMVPIVSGRVLRSWRPSSYVAHLWRRFPPIRRWTGAGPGDEAVSLKVRVVPDVRRRKDRTLLPINCEDNDVTESCRRVGECSPYWLWAYAAPYLACACGARADHVARHPRRTRLIRGCRERGHNRVAASAGCAANQCYSRSQARSRRDPRTRPGTPGHRPWFGLRAFVPLPALPTTLSSPASADASRNIVKVLRRLQSRRRRDPASSSPLTLQSSHQSR